MWEVGFIQHGSALTRWYHSGPSVTRIRVNHFLVDLPHECCCEHGLAVSGPGLQVTDMLVRKPPWWFGSGWLTGSFLLLEKRVID